MLDVLRNLAEAELVIVDLTTNTQVQFEAARAFSNGNSFALILDKPLLELRNGRRAAGVEHEKIT
jgi:hypothetical protein